VKIRTPAGLEIDAERAKWNAAAPKKSPGL
jgi:hypothetical protein